MDIKLSEVPSKEIMPGFHGKLIHTENMTLAYWDVEEGAEVPEHSHMNEQLMQVLEGSFEFTLNGETKVYEPGQLVPIPAHATHSGKALTPCKLMDIFSPAREEYK
ncbi:cupin domain-containing protein [Zeaxanthinibacter sp. PT1]|uniref:cupin domain-containing protein n=1 Tax=Zeaxanthinibacter TaxID=561554 RepID=UPI002349C9B5|nr:cupin domain-containing protein [Zeaxanthinibacter sp. PT1]MDC6352654.1 cupin domain-containing protein [Zeaxanthinibacter sp. PT1]